MAQKTIASSKKSIRASKAPSKNNGNGSAKASREITPTRKALAARTVATAKKLRSPKVLVPLLVAAGLGVAAVRSVVNARPAPSVYRLPKFAADLSPRFSDAMRALTDLGREIRARVR